MIVESAKQELKTGTKETIQEEDRAEEDFNFCGWFVPTALQATVYFVEVFVYYYLLSNIINMWPRGPQLRPGF